MKIKKSRLDRFESKLEASLTRGEWTSVDDDDLKNSLRQAAQRTLRELKKEARVNIRMSPIVVALLKKRAAREGVGYQTLMSSIIHRYISGDLVDKEAVDHTVNVLLDKVTNRFPKK
ncbi:MAG: antitoxin [Deltaproteobacteria bacterium]|nr:antitoxin [Deltaproteobacteria bacterium]MBI3295970.1 antitoxin [Deltaproteobacteria bacterium]